MFLVSKLKHEETVTFPNQLIQDLYAGLSDSVVFLYKSRLYALKLRIWILELDWLTVISNPLTFWFGISCKLFPFCVCPFLYLWTRIKNKNTKVKWDYLHEHLEQTALVYILVVCKCLLLSFFESSYYKNNIRFVENWQKKKI